MRPPRGELTEFSSAVGRNARWSLVQTVVSALTVFVLYKYLYGHLGPEQLGLWAVVLASVSLSRLAELGFSTTVLRYVSQHLSKGDRTRAAQILETGLVSVGTPFLIFLLLLYPLIEGIVSLFVPESNVAEASKILPYAVGTLWFGVAGSIAQSGLDGCGRMDVKSKILIIGNLVYVPVGIMLSEHWGVPGLAAAQLFQSMVVVVLIWIAIRRELPELGWVPVNWSRSCFAEIIHYAAGMQLGNLLIMLTEPATKMLLSRYCGLTEVAHFEMANQVVARVRALITSAMQAYLPLLSATAPGDSQSKRHVIGEAFIFGAGFGMPLMAILVVSFPIISIAWIGNVEPNFVTYGWIIGSGWLVATLAMPTYFYCVGTGKIKIILTSQVLRVSLNVGLGYASALHGLGYWVAVSLALSLVAENVVTTRRALSDMGIHLVEILWQRESRKTLATIGLTLFVLVLNIAISHETTVVMYVYVNFLVHTLVLLLIAYSSSARLLLLARCRRCR